MMGSRGEPSVQVAALATLLEIADLLRNADKTLPAGVAELREAAVAAKAAHADLDKKTAALDARHRVQEARATTLEGREIHAVERERACVAREEATARQQATFDKQKAAIATLNQEISDRANLVAADAAALDAAKLLHAADHEAKAKALVEETDRQHRESEAVIQTMRDRANRDIAAWRAKNEDEIATQHEALRQREDKIAAREEELHRERARFRALLQE